MELNQERAIVDHAKNMRAMYTKLLTIEEKHDEDLKIMEENHKEEMSYIQENHDELIKGTKANQVSLQNKLQVMEVTQYNQRFTFQDFMDTMEEIIPGKSMLYRMNMLIK